MCRAISNTALQIQKKRNDGVDGESTVEQQETVIMPELRELLSIIDNKQLPPKVERYLNLFANAYTVWGWDMENPTELFLLITKLNNEYDEL